MHVSLILRIVGRDGEEEQKKKREEREQLALNKERKNMGATRFQPIEKMRIETAVYIMHKRWVALKMSFKHRQETREYTDT